MFQCFSCFPVLSEGAQEQEGDSHHQGDDLFVAISPGQFPWAIEDYVAVIFICHYLLYNSVGHGWVLMVKFHSKWIHNLRPIQLCVQSHSSSTLWHGDEHARVTMENWEFVFCYSKIDILKKQPKITVNPCKPPKNHFSRVFGHVFHRKKQTFGVGFFFRQELSETLAFGCPEASCLSTFSDCLIRVCDECYRYHTHKHKLVVSST